MKLKQQAALHGFYRGRTVPLDPRYSSILESDPELNELTYLGWDQKIERSFINGIRYFLQKIKKEQPHNCHVKIDQTISAPPFTDIAKTILLDLLDESEDGKNRIDYSDDEKLKSKIGTDLKRLSSLQSQ
ncbi:MAG: hypothetical protein HOA17_09190 [Candidatus Melainabacteria bacterium]|nr:hypothetical protein [Candidatus Melainabacteria bacterium]